MYTSRVYTTPCTGETAKVASPRACWATVLSFSRQICLCARRPSRLFSFEHLAKGDCTSYRRIICLFQTTTTYGYLFKLIRQ